MPGVGEVDDRPIDWSLRLRLDWQHATWMLDMTSALYSMGQLGLFCPPTTLTVEGYSTWPGYVCCKAAVCANSTVWHKISIWFTRVHAVGRHWQR
jgi:hypothetical protein